MSRGKTINKNSFAKNKKAVTKHFLDLKKRYQQVGRLTWLNPDFQFKNIQLSRNLFTPKSLQIRRPVPKALEVHACLSGLPFPKNFIDKLVAVQNKISKVLGQSLHYWVAPKNFGLEYCVFKWPRDPWSKTKTNKVKHALAAVPKKSFVLFIKGVQINPDGCVVAKGFDQDAEVFHFRRKIKSEIAFMPAKQSKWCHVPMGRILEPVGPKKFSKLKALIDGLANLPITKTKIRVMKLIHEERWYMEKRKTLSVYYLNQWHSRH